MVSLIIKTTILLLFSFIIISDVIFAILIKFKVDKNISKTYLFILTRGLGPAIISSIYYYLYIFFPNLPYYFYFSTVLVLVFAGAVYSYRELPQILETYKSIAEKLRTYRYNFTFVDKALLIVLAALLLATLYFGVVIPVVEHDALSYLVEARIMVRDRNMDNYLSVWVPDPGTGYYNQNFQAPFLQCLYMFYFHGLGNLNFDLPMRFIAPLFGVLILILIGYITYKEYSITGALTALIILFSTPIFFRQMYSNSQDTPRWYYLLLALIWISETLNNNKKKVSKKFIIISTLSIGIALYSHVINIIAVGIFCIFLFVHRRQLNGQARVLILAGIILVLSPGFLHYVVNEPNRSKIISTLKIRDFSMLFIPLRDKILSVINLPVISANVNKIWESLFGEPQKALLEQSINQSLIYKAELRGQGNTWLSQLLRGRFQMFTGLEHFGWTFYFFIFSLYRSIKSQARYKNIFLSTILIATLIVISGIRKSSWSNPRYIGTCAVLIPYFVTPQMEDVINKIYAHWKKIGTTFTIIFLLAPLIASTTILGIKIGATNDGNFYKLVNTDTIINNPALVANTIWQDYFGLRKSIIYSLSSQEDMLINANDSLATTVYINNHLDADDLVMVWRVNRYFYYSDIPGIVWFDPRIYPDWYDAETEEQIFDIFIKAHVTHMMIDTKYENYPNYINSKLPAFFNNPRYATMIYEFGLSKVYKINIGNPP